MKIVLELTQKYRDGTEDCRTIPVIANSVAEARAQFNAALNAADGLFHVFGQDFISDVACGVDAAQFYTVDEWFEAYHKDTNNETADVRPHWEFQLGDRVVIARRPYFTIADGKPDFETWEPDLYGDIGMIAYIDNMPEWCDTQNSGSPEDLVSITSSDISQLVISASCLDKI